MRCYRLSGIVARLAAILVVGVHPCWSRTDVAVGTTLVLQTPGNDRNPTPSDDDYWCTLTISSSEGGRIIAPGEGSFDYFYGEVVIIEAEAEPGYRFSHWSGNFWSVSNPEFITMNMDYVITAQFEPANSLRQAGMGFSAGEIGFDDADEFAERVVHDNFEHPVNRRYNRLHVTRIEGSAPDPTGMMRMRILRDADPASLFYSRFISARAKMAFDKCHQERILVRFSYLFERRTPGLRLVAYLSDVPDLLNDSSPLRREHYVEIGGVAVPPTDRPGSVDSRRFGTFEGWVSTGSLDLSRGTWIELELTEAQALSGDGAFAERSVIMASSDSEGGSVLADDCAIEIHCDGICLDLNWSDTANEEDFLLLVASVGSSAGLLEGGVGSRYCLDGTFSSDGYVDAHDIASWDWSLKDISRVACNFCRVPLPLTDAGTAVAAAPGATSVLSNARLQIAASGPYPGDLLLLGKRTKSKPFSFSDLLADRLGFLDGNGNYQADYLQAGVPDRCNVRVVRGPGPHLYVVNSERGVLQIDDAVTEVIPPGAVPYANEPRSHGTATVYVGIQGQSSDSFGRPILDAAFDAQGNAYVVPVVVQPARREAYVAAARLELRPGDTPPYRVTWIYDDPPPSDDNQRRDHLREIEVDDAGNVYLANVHSLNESDILWKYTAAGTLLQRLHLMAPDSEADIRDPTALHVSHDGATLYLTSGQCNPGNPNNTTVYGLSTNDLSPRRSFLIGNMRQATAVADDPVTGTLWVLGFSMPEVPEHPSLMGELFYKPVLARVTTQTRGVEAVPISGQHDLALPTSMVWTGAME